MAAAVSEMAIAHPGNASEVVQARAIIESDN
jgi:hypothetical protein